MSLRGSALMVALVAVGCGNDGGSTATTTTTSTTRPTTTISESTTTLPTVATTPIGTEVRFGEAVDVDITAAERHFYVRVTVGVPQRLAELSTNQGTLRPMTVPIRMEMLAAGVDTPLGLDQRFAAQLADGTDTIAMFELFMESPPDCLLPEDDLGIDAPERPTTVGQVIEFCVAFAAGTAADISAVTFAPLGVGAAVEYVWRA